MSDQWGHGFHTGKKEGIPAGREEMFNLEMERDVAKNFWVAECMAQNIVNICQSMDKDGLLIEQAEALLNLCRYALQNKEKLDQYITERAEC